jgi:hypothetical protein
MAVTKTEVVSVRVPPNIKAALVAAAEGQRRSIASMVEIMVLDYCQSQGIAVQDQKPERPASGSSRKSAS